jgi:hypothetical protein
MKGIKIILFIVTIYFLALSPVFASGFNLKSIDGVDTDGKLYSQWYHTSLQPTFSGEAPGDSTVDIKIDDTDYSTTADESGNWTWTPPEALAAGDHSVTLTNNDSLIAFTLTLGEENINWDEVGSGGDGDTLPTVGIAAPTIILLTAGTAISGHFFKKFLLH